MKRVQHSVSATQGTRTIGMAIGVLCLSVSISFGQESSEPQPVEIPATATVLEGIPTVRADAAEGGAARRLLSELEAAQSRLTVGLVDDRYYWASRENRPLQKFTMGAFTYLSSAPGHYIRFTRLNDRIAYEEHVDSVSGSTTWWGELRIVVGK
jgi:hypothetical protein